MRELFVNQTPVLELIVRAASFYIIYIALIRLAPLRAMGGMNSSDFILIILLIEPAARSLGSSDTILDAVIQLVVFVAMHIITNHLARMYAWFDFLVSKPPVKVVEDGKFLRGSMRRELLTVRELETNLREGGVSDVSEVESAYLESDGKISVVKKNRSEG